MLNISLDVKNIGLKFDRSSVESTGLGELHMDPGELKFVRDSHFSLLAFVSNFLLTCSKIVFQVRFCVVSKETGTLSLDYVSYELELGSLKVPFLQKVVLKGRRLNSNKEERCGKIYSKDLRNKFMIVEKAPLLQVN